MAAVGQKFELALVRRVIGSGGAVYRSPAMSELGSKEDQRRQSKPIESFSVPEPWFDVHESARGWGFTAVCAVSAYFSYRFLAWFLEILFE